MPQPRLLLVVNTDWFFLSHRLAVAVGARQAGYDVHLACGNTGRLAEIEAHGIVVHELPISRRGMSVLEQIGTVRAMAALMRALRPDIVHLVTIKPVLLGGLAARLARVRAVVAAISGMGYVFIARGAVARLRRALVSLLYRAALGRRNVTVIVQNPDDAALVTRLAGLAPSRIERIRGSGVDLAACAPAPLPDGEPVVVFAARLLGDKGLREFVAAARMLKADGIRARFVVAGDPDLDNPASVLPAEIEAWRREGVADFVGFQADVPGLFAAAHLVVLPSYREGLPKVLLEAAACGRAVVTTDVPGCRDAVEAGRTALLVPAMEAKPLAAAIRRLVEDRALCAGMGEEGRRLAEAEFSIGRVVEAHLAIYARVLEETA
ncbi:MAG TPA: glycosyltransferase family 4 protein [Allosphingosinicella sp.]